MFMAQSCCRKVVPFGFLFSSPKGPTTCFIVSGSVLFVPTLQLMSWPNSRDVSAGTLFNSVWMVAPKSLCSFGSTGW